MMIFSGRTIVALFDAWCRSRPCCHSEAKKSQIFQPIACIEDDCVLQADWNGDAALLHVSRRADIPQFSCRAAEVPRCWRGARHRAAHAALELTTYAHSKSAASAALSHPLNITLLLQSDQTGPLVLYPGRGAMWGRCNESTTTY